MEARMKIHPAASSAIAASATNRVPPAPAAREALSAQPDLAGLPFGKLVSAFARGLPLPVVAGSAPETSSSATIPLPEADPAKV